MNTFYPTVSSFEIPVDRFNTCITVENRDTLGAAKHHHIRLCLNFASHKRPGGGYLAVRDVRGPISTQEEDLFRRSNLPELMDTPEIRNFYPLQNLEAIYTEGIVVSKDPFLHDAHPFIIDLITLPAVVDPQPHQAQLVAHKMQRILEIALDNDHDSIILGAWGCGAFRNDPYSIATHFHDLFSYQFKGAFKQVVFAIPNKDHPNFQTFEEVFSTP